MLADMYLVKRQFGDVEDVDISGYNWWYTPTAYAVKWSALLALFVIFFLWITLGYYHARRRIKAGLKPLSYHKWLVPRSQREPQPPQNARSYYAPGSFGMQGQQPAEPPPVYSNTDMPPTYQPPEGGSKVALELVEQQRATQQESGSASVVGQAGQQSGAVR